MSVASLFTGKYIDPDYINLEGEQFSTITLQTLTVLASADIPVLNVSTLSTGMLAIGGLAIPNISIASASIAQLSCNTITVDGLGFIGTISTGNFQCLNVLAQGVSTTGISAAVAGISTVVGNTAFFNNVSAGTINIAPFASFDAGTVSTGVLGAGDAAISSLSVGLITGNIPLPGLSNITVSSVNVAAGISCVTLDAQYAGLSSIITNHISVNTIDAADVNVGVTSVSTSISSLTGNVNYLSTAVATLSHGGGGQATLFANFANGATTGTLDFSVFTGGQVSTSHTAAGTNDVLMLTLTTAPNSLQTTIIESGLWNVNTYAYCSGGTSVQLYSKAYYVDADGVTNKTLIADGSVEPIIVPTTLTAIDQTLNVNYVTLPDLTKRIIVEWYGNFTGGSRTLNIITGDGTLSHIHTTLLLGNPPTVNTSSITASTIVAAGYVSTLNINISSINGGPLTGACQAFYHTEAQGVNGGAATGYVGAWSTLLVNATTTQTVPGMTLSDSIVVIPPGIYGFDAAVPVNGVGRAACRLYNITGAHELVHGTSIYVNTGFYGAANVAAFGALNISTSVAAALQLQVEQNSTLGDGTNSLGLACNFAGDGETYASMKFTAM